MRQQLASERRGQPRPRGGGRVRRRQVPRQRDAGNGGRGRSERSERSPLRDKLLPLRSSAHKKKRGCLKSRRTDSHLLFLYYVRMVLPSAELRSASPHFGPSQNLLRHRFSITCIFRAPPPALSGGGYVRLFGSTKALKSGAASLSFRAEHEVRSREI